METDRVLVVFGEITKLNSVPALDKVGGSEGNDLVLETCWVNGHDRVVNLKISDGDSLGVNEQVGIVAGHLLEIEVDHSVTKIVVSLLQSKLEIVLNFSDQRSADSSLFLGQKDS